MKKLLLTTVIIVAATFAIAGERKEAEIRQCGDNYLGSETYYYYCKAKIIENEFYAGVKTEGKTAKELKEMEEIYWLETSRKHLYCAVVLGVSSGDFLKIQECYND